MKFCSAISTAESAVECVDECAATVAGALSSVDLLFVFLARDFVSDAATVLERIHDRLAPGRLLGCSAESISGDSLEVELAPGISMLAGSLPDANIDVMHLQYQRTADGAVFTGWSDRWLARDGQAEQTRANFLLADPYSFPTDVLIEQLAEGGEFAPLLGGMASGGAAPNENVLLVDREVVRDGAVLATVQGDLQVDWLVSQGCRPVGEPFVITQAERNVIQGLGGKPALEQLQAVFDSAANREQQLMQSALHVGRVVSEYQDSFQQGDFLIRNVLGADRENGAIAIADYVRPGQTVQFHIRDESTADAELKQLLAEVEAKDQLRGALLFSCNGRGTRLFSEPHHDAATIRNALSDLPLAGFFAQGELGPIGESNFVHGFTASVALWRDRTAGK